MKLDLSVLSTSKPISGEPNSSNDGLMQLDISDISADPDQTRKHFDKKSLEELAETIVDEGVIQPIIVKRNPSKTGGWLIVAGERRYRASILAKMKKIPAISREGLDGYAHVVENVQREDLTPRELAEFINGRVKLGDKKVFIAQKLGLPPARVSDYLTMINPPKEIGKAIDSGACKSPAAVAQLCRLYKKSPDAVRAFCKSSEEITQARVKALKDRLSGQGGSAASKNEKKKPKLRPVRPQVSVNYKGRSYRIVMTRQPSSPELVFIRDVETGSQEEVKTKDVSIEAFELV